MLGNRNPNARGNESNQGYHVSLVVTVQQDAMRIGRTLKRLRDYLKTVPWKAEVIVVDDGSQDGTGPVAARWRDQIDSLVVIRHDVPRGRGAAVRTGVLIARGEFVVVTDIALETPIENLTVLLENLRAGSEVATVSRRISEFGDGKGFLERATETTFFTLSKLMLQVGVRDTLSGFMGFHTRAGKKIAERSRVEGEAWAVEWMALAQYLGFQVIECAARFTRPNAENEKLSATSFLMLRDVWKTRRRLNAEDYSEPLPKQELLSETSFVKVDRSMLLSGQRSGMAGKGKRRRLPRN